MSYHSLKTLKESQLGKLHRTVHSVRKTCPPWVLDATFPRGDSGTSVAALEVCTVFLIVVNMMKRSRHLKGKGTSFEVVSWSAGRAKT